MAQRLTTILAVFFSIAVSCCRAEETDMERVPIVEIYDYTGDVVVFLEPPSLEEVRKHGNLLFSGDDVKDLKPVEGFSGRFILEVTKGAEKLFWKTVFSGYEGELVMVIDGKPREETLHACVGCKVIDGRIDAKELMDIRKRLARRSELKPKESRKKTL